MKSVPIGLLGLLLAPASAAAQYPPPGPVPAGACEIRPDAPYINPRLPLGRAAYAQRPACRTTWVPGRAGPGLHVQGRPVTVDAPPVSVGGLTIYLVPPEILVRPSEVTVEPPQIHGGEAATLESPPVSVD